MSHCDLSTYTALADTLASLPLLLRAERRRRQLSSRAAAAELGVSPSTVVRIEAGEDHVASHAVAVLRWLDTQPADTGETP